MVPPRVHVLDRFPMLPNGKVDRAGLLAGTVRPATPPQPADPADGLTDDSMDDLARRVTEEWCAVLPSATGVAEEDFFAAGGDSLAAMRLANRLQVVLDEAGPTSSPAAGDAGSPATDAADDGDDGVDGGNGGDGVISVHTVIGHPVLRDLVEAVRAAREPA